MRQSHLRAVLRLLHLIPSDPGETTHASTFRTFDPDLHLKWKQINMLAPDSGHIEFVNLLLLLYVCFTVTAAFIIAPVKVK